MPGKPELEIRFAYRIESSSESIACVPHDYASIPVCMTMLSVSFVAALP
jgi:hypothetical protein